MSRDLPILAVQAAPVAWDVEATWQKFELEVRTLSRSYPAVRLFAFPELYLAAVGAMNVAPPTHYSSRGAAETIPGPLTDRLGKLAREVGAWLVPGSVYELGDDGRTYNTALAIAPDGSVRATYRKVFPWRPWETTAAGSTFTVFDVEDVGRLGLMICYDGWFPEVARQLAWLGAEVIVHPTATPTSDRAQELAMARANAIANQVYVVNVNMGGRPGPGRSAIVDPEGHVLQLAGDGEEQLVDVLDLDVVTRVRRYGSVGMNRLWSQLDAEGPGIPLPMYGGAIRARPADPAAGGSGAGEAEAHPVPVAAARY